MIWSPSVTTRTFSKGRCASTWYLTLFSWKIPQLFSFRTTVPGGRSTGVGAGLGRSTQGRRAGGVLGRGGSATGVNRKAVIGVVRPGSPWWGRCVL